MRRTSRAKLASVAGGLAAVTAVFAAGTGASPTSGYLLPTDRVVAPAGRITPLDYFPTGAAVSPDGSHVVAIAGGPVYGTAGSAVTIDVIDAASGRVLQALKVGDAFQSVSYTADGSTVYVAGGADGVVHTFSVLSTGLLQAGADLPVGGFVTSLALDPQGHWLWAAGSESGKVTRLDPTGAASAVTAKAPNPDELALSPDGTTLYATNWRGSTVTAIDTSDLTTRTIAVGDHPSGIAVLDDGTLVVADANDGTLATVRPGDDTAVFTDLRQVGIGSDAPSAIAVGPHHRLYVTLAGDDAVAVLDPGHGPHWKLAGLIPTGWYPTAATLSPDNTALFVVTGKGLGHGAAATAPYVTPDPGALSVDAAYATVGDLETVSLPDSAGLAVMTAQVHRTLTTSTQQEQANPVLGRHSPIKHIIYITRENKTYDADLGDLHPGPGNALVLFGQNVTPNLHALERGFVESQNFTYPATASKTGHMWEDAGGTSDVFERADGDGNLNDSWHDPTNYPSSGLLVEQAWRAGLAVRTYNEELAQQSGLLPVRFQAGTDVFPNYDLAVPDVQREAGWETEFKQFETHQCTGVLASAYGSRCELPALEYVYLGEDHTTVVDEPGFPTVEAQVADNDLATGKVIDAVSHSPDWASTLVIAVEDDPQSTGDDESAYRGFIALASPWVKRGYISTVPYNLAGVVGAIDRILHLPPLTDFAATSRPLDDLFITGSRLSSADLTPYAADSSGIALYPFTPLPGVAPSADPAHGIYSFTEPDATDPVETNAATWAQVHQLPIPTLHRTRRRTTAR
jgi:YVTN family beta-propeller protein